MRSLRTWGGVERKSAAGTAGWIHLLPLLVMWLIPVAAVLIAVSFSSVSEKAAVTNESPTTVTVGSRANDGLTGVEMTIGLTTGLPLLASATGVVTAVPIASGQDITQGMPILEVNYQRVLAFRSSTPLYRDLKIGDTGRDVRLLASFLKTLGYLSHDTNSDQYGPNIQAAVRRLEVRIGAPATGTFSLRYVSFVPPTMTTVNDVRLQVGDVVGPTTIVASGTRIPVSFDVQNANEQKTLARLLEGKLLVRAGLRSFKLSGIQPQDSELQPLLEFLASASQSGDATETTSADGSSIRFSAVRLALAEPEEVGTIPGSALYISESGTWCLFVEDDRVESDFAAVSVSFAEPLDGEVGSLAVDPARIGDVIARQPERLSKQVLEQC